MDTSQQKYDLLSHILDRIKVRIGTNKNNQLMIEATRIRYGSQQVNISAIYMIVYYYFQCSFVYFSFGQTPFWTWSIY